jgi:hypothetical protein
MVKIIYKIVILFVLMTLLNACSINQSIHFNENFSGTYSFKYDFSKFTESIAKDENIINISDEDYNSYTKNIEKLLKSLDGINNFVIINDAENGVLFYSFDFDNIETLNKSLEIAYPYKSKKATSSAPKFELKRKTLFFYRNPIDIEEDIESVEEMFTNNLEISFDTEFCKVKGVDERVKIDSLNRKINERSNIKEFSSKEILWEFKFSKWHCIF